MALQPNGALRALLQELKNIQKDPVQGFVVSPQETNQFNWNVAIFGPPGTVYEGGYFKALMKFPQDYPYSPPSLQFTTRIWHPNIYPNGDVCISILHPPTADPTAGELPEERWNPTQTVRTILLSVISMLNEPNISSPANVDASVAYRDWLSGRSTQFGDAVRKQVESTLVDAASDGVTIPSNDDWLKASNPLLNKDDASALVDAGIDDMGSAWYDDAADDDYDDDQADSDDEDDSGTATDH